MTAWLEPHGWKSLPVASRPALSAISEHVEHDRPGAAHRRVGIDADGSASEVLDHRLEQLCLFTIGRDITYPSGLAT